MSAKNQLQEYCQKMKWGYPEYTAERLGGSDHQPEWIARVKIQGEIEMQGEIEKTKGLAEASAAAKLIQHIKKDVEVTKKIDGKGCILLVDVENLPNFIDEINDKIINLDIYAFIGYHHCLSNRGFPANVTKIESHSTRRDGSDTCMQVYTGFLLAQMKYNTYFIATRDHYGSSLVDMILHQPGPWINMNAHLVTQPNHLYKLLS